MRQTKHPPGNQNVQKLLQHILPVPYTYLLTHSCSKAQSNWFAQKNKGKWFRDM